MISEQEMQDILREALNEHVEDNEESPIDHEVFTFEDMGILSMNKGLVITADGGESEFQISIVRSR